MSTSPESEGNQEKIPEVKKGESTSPLASPTPSTPIQTETPAAKVEAKVAPTKPTVTAGKVAQPERRKFLSWFLVAWVAFAGATMGALSMVLRFLFPNVLFEPKTLFKAGYPHEYEIGVVDVRWTKQYGVWLVRTMEGIYALSTICTHLGCTPSWLSGENKFKCPCHGSGYNKQGINIEGPAPRPLERFRITLADDGQILVDKSKLFQQEKGEWKDPEALLLV